MEQWAEYDYVIINEKLEQSFDRVQSILHAERMRRDRLIGMKMFVEGLLNEL